MRFIEDQATFDRLLIEISESSGEIAQDELLRRAAEEEGMETALRVFNLMVKERQIGVTNGRVHFLAPPGAQESR